LKRYSKSRYYAVLILKQVLEDGRWANKLLTYYSFKLNHQDAGLLTILVNGTVKFRLFEDWVLYKYIPKKKLERLTPWIRTVLRMGVYQLYFLESVPDYAVVNESVELAKRFGHRGTAGLVNAVLKTILREKPRPDEIWVKYSHPRWLYERLVQIFGNDTAEKVMQHNNEAPQIFVRVNTLKIPPNKFEELLISKGVEFKKFDFPPVTYRLSKLPHLVGIPDEFYLVQDLSSQVIPYLVAPQGVDYVLDMAGAPGAKITHIFQINHQIKAYSVELHFSRAKEIKRLSKRLGAMIHVINGDSTYIDFNIKFHRILLDTPCSGLGTLRRHAELRWRMRPERIEELNKIQMALLENAARLVRKDGVIVYSTCTIIPQENQGVVQWFLERHSEFTLEDAKEFIPHKFTDGKYLFVNGLKHSSDFSFAARLKKVD